MALPGRGLRRLQNCTNAPTQPQVPTHEQHAGTTRSGACNARRHGCTVTSPAGGFPGVTVVPAPSAHPPLILPVSPHGAHGHHLQPCTAAEPKPGLPLTVGRCTPTPPGCTPTPLRPEGRHWQEHQVRQPPALAADCGPFLGRDQTWTGRAPQTWTSSRLGSRPSPWGRPPDATPSSSASAGY